MRCSLRDSMLHIASNRLEKTNQIKSINCHCFSGKTNYPNNLLNLDNVLHFEPLQKRERVKYVSRVDFSDQECYQQERQIN